MKIKFFAGFILICILIAGMPLKAMAEKPPYPIILIHGLNSSYTMWDEVVAQFKSYGWTYGGVLSVDLNKDDNNNTGSIAKDVEEPIWKEFDYNANGDFFLLNFDTMYSHSWDASSLSNQAAIRKQGKALNLCIKEILVDKGLWYNQVNGRVILIGHSMGGLSAREYLQRLSDDLMPNNHEWWVKPNEEGGHRVARLVTIGTPHLGSWMWNFKIISGVENKSEATRDLRCNDGTGVYLFGGFESDIPDSFYNKDVNCDGNNNTLYRITGLNEYDKKGKLKMPLPSDVKYVCIIGNASELYGTPFGLDDSDGDGVVDKMRQNLNSVVPNIATEFIIPACHVDALKPLYQYSVLSECKYHGTIYQALFDTIPKVRWHPDGTLIKSPVSCKAYVLENGKKRHIPDPSTFTAWRYDWGKVITVSTEELNGYPTGIDISPPPSGYPCIRQVGTRVFLIKDGKKHHILSPRVFDSWGYEWSENKVVGSIVEPSGEPVVYREGTLIHGVPSGKVYVVSNETLWHIQDIETFKLLGYNTKNMIDVSDSVLTNTSLNGLKGICFRNINIAYVTSFHKNNGNCPWVVPPPSSPPGVVAVFAGNPYPIPITVFDEAGDISVEVWQTSDDWKNANRIYSSTIAVHSPGSDKYTWTVPNVNTNEAELRIVAYNDAGNVGCAYSGQFSISSSGSIPSTHELYDPGNYTENNYYTISWREISDATSYTLQESTDSSFRQIREYSTTARPQYIAGKENGIYYYRVRANNSQGSSGWSNIVDLEVRVNFPPYTPSNPNIPDGATNVSRMPALTWTGGDPDGTVDYAVRFGTNTSDMCYRKCFGVDANPTYQFSYDLAPGTTYYWQIRAKDDKGLETFGPLWRFTTAYSYADLIPVSLVVDGTITPNSRVTLNLTVKNQGTYVAPWGRVFFYYSSSKGGKEQKLYNFGTLIPELAPGAQTTISQVVTLENLKAGKGYIDAWINTEGYFIEGNIDNNLLSYEINYLDNNSPVISYLGFQWKVFRTGYKYPVGFVVSDDIGIKDLDFYYSTDNGLTWGTITTGFVVGSNFVQNAYYWTIPPDAPLTDQLKIRMVAWDTAMNRTEAMAGPYKIVSGTPPSVKILSPNGGEVWNLGSQQEIKWEVSAPNGISGMSLGIYYRGDRDENDYIDIKTNTTGRYTWTLPNSSCCVTNEARVKIEVSDLNGNRSEDWSDGYFSINDPSSPPLPPWTMPEKITSILSTKGEQYNSNPVVVADKSGNLHMVYRYIQDDQTSNDVRVIKQEILYKKFSGGSWSEPTTIYSMTQKMGVGKLTGCHSIDDLRIAIDSYGYPHIAWLDTINGPFTYFNQDDIYYTYFNGSIWTIPLNISSIAQPLDFTWTTKANMPETKKEAASGMVNGKIYVFGGNDIISNYEYNPTNNTWTRKADLPLCIGKGGAAVINNKIYAVPSYNNIQIYDPVNDSWSTGASIPTLRWGIGVCAVNGRVYAIGGASDKFFNTVEEYNPMTDSWVTKKPMPTARCSSAVAVVNNLMYVFGGKDASNYSSIDTVEVYNPSTDSWSAKASMPTRREGAVAKVI
ncbi:hypothetical protein KKA04_05335, partial [Patescibacteria group bacterium]|nr:hypothetical protein [Patescibacteria group bacterium]